MTMNKPAALKPDVILQPHQERVREEASTDPIRKLLYHTLGSGKSVTALSAAEAQGQPYTIVSPAALRPTWREERRKFTTRSIPADIVSYERASKPTPLEKLHTLIVDEAQNLRNPANKRTAAVTDLAQKAKNLLLLSGTPVTNAPRELAPLISMLSGTTITPREFEQRFVGKRPVSPGIVGRIMGVAPTEEPSLERPEELKELLKGRVDYYRPESSTVPVKYEDVVTEMTTPQSRLYEAMFDRLPWILRWKLKHDYPLTRDELIKTRSFLSGPRQVGLSTYPYQGTKDPLKAFEQSAKLQSAFGSLQEQLKDPRQKAVVFSNFIEAGLTPYAAALGKAGIPHGVFHGGLSDVERKKLVDDFNANKLRVALLGPSGAEGLNLKGPQLMQLLDPYWHEARLRQAEGRGLRFGGHAGLPEDLKNVTIQRHIARLPLSTTNKMLSRIGFDRGHTQRAADDYLRELAAHKDKLNQQFLDLLKEVGSKHDKSPGYTPPPPKEPQIPAESEQQLPLEPEQPDRDARRASLLQRLMQTIGLSRS